MKKAEYGQWQPKNRTLTVPFTTVIKENFNYDDWRQNVKLKLTSKKYNEKQFSALYTKICTEVQTTPTISNAADKPGYNMSINNRTFAQFAKTAAFINYLNVKLDASGIPIDLTTSERTAFRDIAINSLNKIIYDLEGSMHKQDYLQYQDQALVCALQAYDLLQAAGNCDDWYKCSVTH
jgi:hypothetical protein